MLFHEIYGCYYQCVAKILREATSQTLTREKMTQIIQQNAFRESVLTIVPALQQQQWQLLDPSLRTPLKHAPTIPLTTLQKRWLKAISLDPRIQLFDVDFDAIGLDGITPLFTPQSFCLFDQYADGDPYDSPHYISVFRALLKALGSQMGVRVQFTTKNGNRKTVCCKPSRLEYSEKDDKFRLAVTNCYRVQTINVARIEQCDLIKEVPSYSSDKNQKDNPSVTLEVTDQRNALERVMLHFAHLQKRAERISSNRYQVKIYYDSGDETEMIIRILAFGPLVKVLKPASLVNQIKSRLKMQKSCGLE